MRFLWVSVIDEPRTVSGGRKTNSGIYFLEIRTLWYWDPRYTVSAGFPGLHLCLVLVQKSNDARART